MSEIPNKYDPSVEEKKWQKFWEEEKVYSFDPDSDAPIYSIDNPPPTMSGKMHIGHAFSYSQQDFIARYKRLKGHSVFYPFGTDDNGLPTERLVQKEKKVNPLKMERGEFIKLCLEYLDETRPRFIQDWKDLGMSCDFNIVYSTINDHCRKIAQQTFIELAKKDLVYRKEAPVIWDPVLQTAIAQADLVSTERSSFFNDIVFKTEDGQELIIATTRPELLGACVAIFAHPEDERYKPLFGKFATSPLYNVKVPILADEKADPDKGTGIVMCCTFGDQTDIEWFKKHNLPMKMVINRDGTMNEASGKYAGLKTDEAKKQIIEDLRDAGLLKKQEKIKQVVNVGERSNAPIEIVHSAQWYLKYMDKTEDFLQGANELTWIPKHMQHRLDNWIKGLNWDWSISRQRHFGVPVPVWYDKDGKMYFADESQLPVDPLKDRPLSAPEDVELTPDSDVFDTWWTSSSSPFLSINLFKDHPVYEKLFPMDLRPQAHDIVNNWLFYTMAKTRLLKGTNPWKKATISGFVVDPKGNKMSKSKGNVVDPQKVIENYGADAIRFWSATSTLGDDLPYMEKDLLTAKKTITKLWNAAKFAAMHLEDFDGSKPEKLEAIDEWIIAQLNVTIKSVDAEYGNYAFSKGRLALENFFWAKLCDNYLEIAKDRLYNPDKRGEQERKSAQYTLVKVYTAVLQLFAPIMPYITESIYQYFFKRFHDTKSVHLLEWPIADETTPQDGGNLAIKILGATRRFKASQQASLGAQLSALNIQTSASDAASTLEPYWEDLKQATKAKEINIESVDKVTESDEMQSVDETMQLTADIVPKEKK